MKTILLIEDIRINVAEIPELSNYKGFTAENGKLGAARALESKPDLIICNIMRPDLDGLSQLLDATSGSRLRTENRM